MSKTISEAVIVACGRTAIAKAMKGALKDTHPVTYAGELLRGVLDKLPGFPEEQIDDVIIGCATPQGKMGCNMARLIAGRAGLPFEVSAQTVNRFCSSGLQAIATAANSIMAGQNDIVVAGGVETMTRESMMFGEEFTDPWLRENKPDYYMPMGFTAENVAEKYGVSRQRMDAFGAESHRRAAAAREAGKFAEEIIPVHALQEDGNWTVFDTDQGIRPGSTVETLGSLRPSFKEDGVITPGNSSQLSDGAGIVVLMSREKAEELDLKPLARFVGFATGGVDPAYMGLGPIVAIPRVLARTGLTVDDMDVIELNEAFASQALVCMDTLKLDPAKVNPNGGAIAMGHPLGATGAILTCKALAELRRTGGRYGMISMCIGGGMGAAGIIERI